VPAKDRLRRDEERSPALSGYEAGQEADERPIGPREAGTRDLATQHSDLMAKYQYLGILGGRIHATDAKYLKDSSDQ
jgi:hypothetical protein